MLKEGMQITLVRGFRRVKGRLIEECPKGQVFSDASLKLMPPKRCWDNPTDCTRVLVLKENQSGGIIRLDAGTEVYQ